MKRIIKGDKVRVISGKYKSKEGIVLSVDNKNNCAIVEGINNVKRHQKPTAQNENKGGIVEKQLPLNLSKLALVVDKATNGISKVSYTTNKEKKTRVAKKTKTELGGSKK
jgi:large subunit ribosomal protein L24